jgi:hypothetical protein
LFWERRSVNYSRIFPFSRRTWNLTTPKCEVWAYTLLFTVVSPIATFVSTICRIIYEYLPSNLPPVFHGRWPMAPQTLLTKQMESDDISRHG